MRTRMEIGVEIERLKDENHGVSTLSDGERLLLEVLLDIREQLQGAGR